MDDDLMDAYMQGIREGEKEDDEEDDWVLDDEFSARGGGREEEDAPHGMISDLLASFDEPRLPPSPDSDAENKGWLYDIMQNDPRYGETHDVRMAMIQRMAHVSGDSHSITFLDHLNKSYRS